MASKSYDADAVIRTEPELHMIMEAFAKAAGVPLESLPDWLWLTGQAIMVSAHRKGGDYEHECTTGQYEVPGEMPDGVLR